MLHEKFVGRFNFYLRKMVFPNFSYWTVEKKQSGSTYVNIHYNSKKKKRHMCLKNKVFGCLVALFKTILICIVKALSGNS